jgi:hypothetical protein
MSYATIAFSDVARQLQGKAGSRTNYARMEKHAHDDELTDNEKEFISKRDGFLSLQSAKMDFRISSSEAVQKVSLRS